MIVESTDAGAQKTAPAPARRLRAEVRQHYEALLQRLPWPARGAAGAPQTLGVVSCHESEGVSTVAAHLAVTAASLAERGVLLLDANVTAPCVPRIFGVPGRPGLAEVLQEGGESAKAIQPSAVDKLSLLVAGRPADSPSRVYGAAGWEGLLKELTGEFELVVVDLPAGDQSSAALQLAGRLDGVLLVVECGRVQRAAAQRFRELLIRAGAHPLGVVLNKWQKDVPGWLSRMP